MIIPERPSLERRVLTVLEGSAGVPARIPVVLGGCGTGRTSLLLRLRDLIGRPSCQYIDVERVATTPERFFSSIREYSPLPSAHGSPGPSQTGAREAFDATLALLDTARAPGGGPATFLLDEFLELRTFESFPGLRTVLRDFIGALSTSGNRFVLASRYPARALRLLREAPSTFEIIHVTPLTMAEIRSTLPTAVDGAGAPNAIREAEADRAHDELARLVHALSDGRPCVRAADCRHVRHARPERRGRGERPLRSARRRTGHSIAGAGSRTSSGCIAPGATVRSRRS